MVVLGTGFFTCLLWQFWIHFDYGARMPRSPQADSGRTFRISVNHGAIVYVTQAEFGRANFVLSDLQLVQFSVLAALGILRVRYKEL